MDSPYDNTTVIRMKEDFDAFICRSSSQQNARTLSTSSVASVGRLDLDSTLNDHLSEAELLKAKTKISFLENEKAQMQFSRKRAKVEHEKDMENFKREHQRETEKLVNLKYELKALKNKNEDAEQQLVMARQTAEENKATYERSIALLKREKLQMDIQFSETEQSLTTKIRELKSEKLRLTTEVDICKVELEETKTQLYTCQEKNKEINKHLQEIADCKRENVKLENKIKELEGKLSRQDDNLVVSNCMKTQLARLQVLERENRQLKDENKYCKDTQENVFLLHEDISSLKKKLDIAEAQCIKYNELQNKFDELQEKFQGWGNVHHDGSHKNVSPAEMKHQLQELQNTNVMLLEKQGKLQTIAHTFERRTENSEKQLRVMKEKCVREEYKNQQASELIKRLQRKLLLVSKERDCFKQILDSYESEATVNIDAAARSRVEQLDQIVAAYSTQMAQLEQDMSSMSEQYTHCLTRLTMLEGDRAVQQEPVLTTTEVDQKIVADLRQQKADLESQVEKLERENEILEARLEHESMMGNFDPTKTQVLHFQMNPASIAQKNRAHMIENLEKENQKLKQRVEVLENEGKITDITLKVEEKLQEPSTSREVQDMKLQLTTAELKNKRLMEAFKKTSQEFREVCYQLLGYRIDILSANQYKLMNMYAESSDESLLFQQSSDGEVQLLETEYSATLMENVQHYLQEAHSIPAFLSSITLDLFNKQTIMT